MSTHEGQGRGAASCSQSGVRTDTTPTEAILCIGSNIDDIARHQIAEAMARLRGCGCWIVASSDIYPSASGYHNCVLRVLTDQSYASLHAATKAIEHQLGRRPWHKHYGRVAVDIDVVVYDGDVMREQDYRSQYFIHGLRQMAPGAKGE